MGTSGAHQQVIFSRRYVPEADKGKLVIDPTHYATAPRRTAGPRGGRLAEAFLQRFPTLSPFVAGLQLRMNRLAPIHIRALLRLAESYGEQALLAAVTRAQEYRRFDARAVERILERGYRLLDDAPLAPLSGVGPVLLGEVEPGSLDEYNRLDSQPTSTEAAGKDDSEETHGPQHP